MEAVGLAFSVYKDVYFLVMSIYRLGMSAYHYKEEHNWLLEKFHGEYLYLRIFIHVFSAIQKMDANDTRTHVLKHIQNVVVHLGKELSDYRELARKEDKEYSMQCEKFLGSQQLSPTELGSIQIEQLSPPEPQTPQTAVPSKLRCYENFLRRLKTVKAALPKKDTILAADAWQWALFERERLETALTTFREHNNMLSRFEFVIASNISFGLKNELGAATERDLPLHVDESNGYPLGRGRPSFATHARINALVESTDYPRDPMKSIVPAMSTATIQAERAHVPPVSQQMASQAATIKEYKRYDPTATSEGGLTVAALNQLACLLFEAGTSGLHTLPLKSVTNDATQSWFIFEFVHPKGTSSKAPATLQDFIVAEDSPSALSLPLRFHIALTISLAIGAFHADGWLHKSIRSDSVYFFYDQQDRDIIRDPYLVNFEYSRPDKAGTAFAADNDLGRNLYRHPDRQGSPTVKFNKTHDLYSLGIVLLEIGVWQTARSMREEYLDENNLKDTGKVTSTIKDVFVRNAEERLGHTMGPAYKKAVQACLSGYLNTFLDTNDFAFQFHEMVIKNLNIKRLKELD